LLKVGDERGGRKIAGNEGGGLQKKGWWTDKTPTKREGGGTAS